MCRQQTHSTEGNLLTTLTAIVKAISTVLKLGLKACATDLTRPGRSTLRQKPVNFISAVRTAINPDGYDKLPVVKSNETIGNSWTVLKTKIYGKKQNKTFVEQKTTPFVAVSTLIGRHDTAASS